MDPAYRPCKGVSSPPCRPLAVLLVKSLLQRRVARFSIVNATASLLIDCQAPGALAERAREVPSPLWPWRPFSSRVQAFVPEAVHHLKCRASPSAAGDGWAGGPGWADGARGLLC